MKVRHLVVGSGAGGATTAAVLAAAGEDVLVLEEGPRVAPGELPPFSLDQMRGQYRSLGQLVALGAPPIAYAEGRCVGGSTEINSGLYHRPGAALLAEWSDGWGIRDLDADSLAPISDAVEHNLTISRFPDGTLPPASRLLLDGAAAVGWRSEEIPRWFDFDVSGGVRQSMSRTYLVQAETDGARVQPDSWVRRLNVIDGRARSAEVERGDGTTETIAFDTVWVCGGAVQSAALLLRSGIRRNVGRTLSMHPTVKAVAHTDEAVNDPTDVPVVQVREFSPHLSMGGSAANLPMLGLALLRTRHRLDDLAESLPHMPIYYAAIQSEGRGRVRVLPGMRDPLVTYAMTSSDIARLRSGMGRLLELLLAAGAREAIPSVLDGAAITTPDQIPDEVAKLTRRTADVMTVHICSSVPMGEDRTRCAVDSWGRSHWVSGLVVNDAAILDSAPGINPQGTVVALATRNAERYLTDHDIPLPAREFA
ncbi:MAG: GMC family oxidoreductase [Candidatus Nanopelagicales bacterium]